MDMSPHEWRTPPMMKMGYSRDANDAEAAPILVPRSWAGVAPGNNESAGKRLSGRTTKGNRALVSALTQAAHAAARTKHTYLSAQFHRLAGRRGKKRAIMAVAHSILVIAYHLIKSKEPYHDLGSDYLDKHKSQATAKRLIHRLNEMGYNINLDLSESVAA